MPKQIIVQSQSTSETEVIYNVLFWFPITKQPVTQTAGSSWTPSGTSLGASSAENQAIQAGTVKEEGHSYVFPINLAVANIEAFLQQAWANRNAQLNGQGANQFYGSFFDGTTWGAQ